MAEPIDIIPSYLSVGGELCYIPERRYREQERSYLTSIIKEMTIPEPLSPLPEEEEILIVEVEEDWSKSDNEEVIDKYSYKYRGVYRNPWEPWDKKPSFKYPWTGMTPDNKQLFINSTERPPSPMKWADSLPTHDYERGPLRTKSQKIRDKRTEELLGKINNKIFQKKQLIENREKKYAKKLLEGATVEGESDHKEKEKKE